MTINYLSGDVVMVGKEHDIIKDTRLHMQNVRNLNVIIEVLDEKNNILDTIHGIVESGSVNIDGNSLIRRTGSIGITMVDKVLPRNDSLIWITNKIRIYVGIRDNASLSFEDTTHYCLGTFYIGDVSTDISANENIVSVNLEDYMMRWDIEELDETIVIEAGVPLHIAISNVMNMVGEFNLDIEMTNVDVPSDKEFTAGTTILTVIQELRDLYMDYECYYTVDGVFTFKKMKVQLEGEEEVKWVFDNNHDLSISKNKKYNFKGVKNNVMVYGRTLTDGTTVSGAYSIKDEENPFHENKIGKRLKVVTESSLFSIEQCESQAIYELYKSSNLNEEFNITTVPIYFLDANDLIEVFNEERESFEKLIVKSISFDLSIEATMSITANKIYYNSFDIPVIPIEMYRAIADDVVEKITQYGWLSLAEKTINEKFGLSPLGSSDVRVRFQYQEKYGVTAYVVAYPKIKSQTLVIDLADFTTNEGESGSNGDEKGDYADRILGHEVLHLVMNDDFGAVKTSQLPEWYKEGIGELLHGADERTKNVIVVDGEIDNAKLNEVLKNAYEMLYDKRDLEVNTSDYVSAYILCKIIAKKLKDNNSTFQKFHDTIRKSDSDGKTALSKAIATHVGDLQSISDFLVLQVINNNDNEEDYGEGEIASVVDSVDFVRDFMNLDIGMDEIDTGSISGSDYGHKSLNAEDVFNNANADGKILNGFNVIVEKP